jgi:predicted lactoylglutathione lyase
MAKGPVKEMFVNLMVKDLPRSKAFWEGLGFSFNPQFTNENGACLVMGENLYAMLLTEPFYKGFITKAPADTTTTTEVLVAIALESRKAVEEMVEKALKSGGAAHKPPQDHGWMYGHSFQDPDGHVWEPMYADVSKLPS